MQAVLKLGDVLCGQSTFVLQFQPLCADGLTGFGCGAWGNIVDQDLCASLRAHLGDSLTHGTGPDHSHLLEVCIHIRTIMSDLAAALSYLNTAKWPIFDTNGAPCHDIETLRIRGQQLLQQTEIAIIGKRRGF
jgi:hypothetical protein